MHVLITGGAGFIGSYTARALRARGHEVTVLDNFLPQVHTEDRSRSATWNAIRDQVHLIEADVRDRAVLAARVGDFDAVLHLAAETGTGQSMYEVARYADVNVLGTANLLQALTDRRGAARRLVIASSRAVYGEGLYACETHGEHSPGARDARLLAAGEFEPRCPACARPMTPRPTREDATLDPASVYAITKLSQEQLVLVAGASLGLGVVALRYQNVYGAGQSLFNPYTGILSIFSREILAGRDIEIFEDGAESRDFVHVEDIARANVAALESDASGIVCNVGSGQRTTVMEVARLLAGIYGHTGQIRVSGRFRAGDIRHNLADLTRLKARLGVEPAVSFTEGLQGFATWARAELEALGGHANTSYTRSLAEMAERGLLSDGKP